jgi:ADP-heptose:LPS heptosyltransferase
VGTPVVAMFGPTVRAFGYAPSLPRSVLLEIDDLPCRPCSRNGKRPCHRGDLACLVRLEPDLVWQHAAAAGAWPGALAPGALAPRPEE